MKCFESALSPLPQDIKRALLSLDTDIKSKAEEIRLRAGGRVSVQSAGREYMIMPERRITAQDIASIIESATRSSVHTAADSLRAGFVTMEHGHRIGVCGTAVIKNGEISMLRSYSSVNIRVARQIKGAADGIISQIGRENTLIISRPGGGKTTLLRDIIRQISDSGIKCAVCDERSEIAAMYRGVSQFDVGTHTDILDGAPKAEGIMLLMRSMSPQVIAVDEITADEDVKAVEHSVNCAVNIIATVHAHSLDDLEQRPVTRGLISRGLFKRIVTIDLIAGIRKISVYRL